MFLPKLLRKSSFHQQQQRSLSKWIFPYLKLVKGSHCPTCWKNLSGILRFFYLLCHENVQKIILWVITKWPPWVDCFDLYLTIFKKIPKLRVGGFDQEWCLLSDGTIYFVRIYFYEKIVWTDPINFFNGLVEMFGK